MTFSLSLRRRLRDLALSLLLLLPILSHAAVRLPNGEWQHRQVDLSIKVDGGAVEVHRTWQAQHVNRGESRWYLNPGWSDLSFELDSVNNDGTIITIRRADSDFERRGDDLFAFLDDYVIVRTNENDVPGWRWKDRSGNWIDYTDDGKATAYGRYDQVTARLIRNGDGRIDEVEDRHGNVVLTITYNEYGEFTAAEDYTHEDCTDEDCTHRRVEYTWANGALTRVTDVRGQTWSYAYSGNDAKRKMTRMSTPNGQESPGNLGFWTQIDYSGARVSKVTDEEGHVTRYEYDYKKAQRRYVITVTSPTGIKRTTHYDTDGRAIEQQIGNRILQKVVRDGELATHVTDERGLRTTTEYDSNHNPILIRYPDGSEIKSVYDQQWNVPLERTDEAGYKTTYSYHPPGYLFAKIREQIDEGGTQWRATAFTYDTQERITKRTVRGENAGGDPDADGEAETRWTYDTYGNVLTQTVVIERDAQGAPLVEAVTKFSDHDAMGNARTRIDARGKTWRYTFDGAGNALTATDPLSHVARKEYDASGNLTHHYDPLGNFTEQRYSPTGRLVASVDRRTPAQSAEEAGISTYTYDNEGRRETETDQEGATTTYGYDSEGRVSKITDAASNVVHNDYGTVGAAKGMLTAIRYPTYCEEYSYDQRLRAVQTTLVHDPLCVPNARRDSTTLTYDSKGNPVSESDPIGLATTTRYDGLGRPVEITDPLGGKTRYVYDVHGNMTSLIDANSNVYTFEFDLAGRMRAEIRPLGQRTEYAYDENDNLLLRTSSEGNQLVGVYDAAGRREGVKYLYPASNAAAQTVTYHRDARGLLVDYVQTGDTESRADYSRDAKGRMVAERVWYGSGSDTVTAETKTAYRKNGQKRRFEYPNGIALDYSYDSANRLATVLTPFGPFDYGQYQWYAPRQIVMPGALRSVDYDALMRPARIRGQVHINGAANPAGTTFMDYQYEYGADGNVASVLSDEFSTPFTYTYDKVNRLTSASPPIELQLGGPNGMPVEEYAYDGVGNRIRSGAGENTWEYNGNSELVRWTSGSELHTQVFDQNGAMTSRVSLPANHRYNYEHNAAERLSALTQGEAASVVAMYSYDPFGRRIRKVLGSGESTWFLYSGDDLIEERNSGANRLVIWHPDDRQGSVPIGIVEDGALSVFHVDMLGTPQKLTDSNGDVVWSGQSESFGTTRSAVNTVNNPFRFAGQYFDSESGLAYNRFRMYDAESGRYVARDPLWLNTTINSYDYANANPINWTDELGLTPKKKTDGVVPREGVSTYPKYTPPMDRDPLVLPELPNTADGFWKQSVPKSWENWALETNPQYRQYCTIVKCREPCTRLTCSINEKWVSQDFVGGYPTYAQYYSTWGRTGCCQCMQIRFADQIYLYQAPEAGLDDLAEAAKDIRRARAARARR